jgi:hypothetical protein
MCSLSAQAPRAPEKFLHPIQPPTDVCITIDTEFSIAGAFADPRRYRPLSEELVECRVDGRSEGLGFILNALEQASAAATFFVETLQCAYFGDGPMGRIVARIAGAGQDLQLHLHPCWLHFASAGWSLLQPANDACAARSLDELTDMIELGCNAFVRWGLPRPVALRVGGFSCGRVVLRAMRRCGIELGSNIALAVHRPADPELHVVSGRALVDDVLELPALTYATPHPPFGTRLRTAAITSTSWPEMETLLRQARAAGISPVVILTHPFEFVKRASFRYEEMRRNQVNQHRFERLLEFLVSHPDEFAVTTFAKSAMKWREAGESRGPLLRVSTRLALARMAQNLANTKVWRY